jgi:hypothetical protein
VNVGRLPAAVGVSALLGALAAGGLIGNLVLLRHGPDADPVGNLSARLDLPPPSVSAPLGRPPVAVVVVLPSRHERGERGADGRRATDD